MGEFITITMRCDHCGYGWESRVANPKACPRCKRRFDYVFGGLE